MKKAVSISVGVLGVLFIVALMPAASYAADPSTDVSESQKVDTSVPKFVAAPSDHYTDVSESQKVDTTVPKFAATPSDHYMDVSESQKVDTGANAKQAIAKTPKNIKEKCSDC